jgi:hypothetical protein
MSLLARGDNENQKAINDVANDLVTFVKLENFNLYIHPSYDLNREGYSFGESTLNDPDAGDDAQAEFYITLVTKKHSLIAFRRHLFVNNKHYDIPDLCKEVWLIGDMLVCQGHGIINETKTSPDIDLLLSANRYDCAYDHEGIKYVSKDSLVRKCVLKNHDKDNYSLVVGDRFFEVTDGILNYSGRNYVIDRGDNVIVNRQGELKIVSASEDNPK